MNWLYRSIGLLCGLAIGYAFGRQYKQQLHKLRATSGPQEADCSGGLPCTTCPSKRACERGCLRLQEAVAAPKPSELVEIHRAPRGRASMPRARPLMTDFSTWSRANLEAFARDASAALRERPASEPMTDEINLVLTDPDSKLSIGAARALRYVLRILARERPGAQAPSTADVYLRVTRPEGYEDDHPQWVVADMGIHPAFKVEVLAAPSTGGAETAPLYGFDRENVEAVAESLATGYEASINVGNTTGEGDEHIESTTAYAARFIRTVLASSAPPQTVETAGAREQDFEKGWRTAANWMERDDLIADIGSAAYLKDRAAALQSPASQEAPDRVPSGLAPPDNVDKG